jgi:hypothetical protein
MRICDRCDKPVEFRLIGVFTNQWICLSCLKKERKHPEYRQAREYLKYNLENNNYSKKYGLPPNYENFLEQIND